MRWGHVVGLAGLTIGIGACASDHVTGTTPPPPADSTVVITAQPQFDLRFKGVGVLQSNAGIEASDVSGALGQWDDAASGTPLEVGMGLCGTPPTIEFINCAWFFVWFQLPESVTGIGGANTLSTIYMSDYIENLPTFFGQVGVSSDSVFTGFDLEVANYGFAFSKYVTPGHGGYVLAVDTVAASGLQAAATALGAQRRVITALSFNSGSVVYLSYSWAPDTTTFDATVSLVPLASVATTAQTMAASGYVITAVGGDSADGFVVVGTRAHGATAARSLIVDPTGSDNLTGFAPVAYLFNDANGGSTTMIVEK